MRSAFVVRLQCSCVVLQWMMHVLVAVAVMMMMMSGSEVLRWGTTLKRYTKYCLRTWDFDFKGRYDYRPRPRRHELVLCAPSIGPGRADPGGV